MGWEVVAQGTSIFDLESTVGELELPHGSKIKVVLNLTLPLGWAFNLPGAELIFRPFIPDGTDLVDVYGEGSEGIVELEADPVWLLAFLLFLKAHWLAITIAGFVLATIIALIIVLVKIAVSPALPIAGIAIAGGLALIGVLALIVSKKREVIL